MQIAHLWKLEPCKNLLAFDPKLILNELKILLQGHAVGWENRVSEIGVKGCRITLYVSCLPDFPFPFSPVQRALKFSTVFGTALPYKPKMIRPSTRQDNFAHTWHFRWRIKGHPMASLWWALVWIDDLPSDLPSISMSKYTCSRIISPSLDCKVSDKTCSRAGL